MINKINLLINISLFPFQNLSFLGQKKIMAALGYIEEKSEVGKADRQKAQKELRIEIQNEVLRKARPKSMDEINLLMQKFYPMLCSDEEADRSGFRFKASKNPPPIEKKIYLHYFHILEEFGDALISYRDGDVVFKYWKNDINQDKQWKFIDFMDQYKGQDKVHFFHAISRFIPLDLIIMLHFIKNGLHDPIQLHEFYQHVNLADAALDDILRRGVAENHIHASAAFNFSILWQTVMNGRIGAGYLQKFLPNHLATSKHNVESYILTARLLRLVMTIYLKEQVYRNHIENCQTEAVVHEHPTFFSWLKNSFDKDTQTLELLWSLIRDKSCEFAKPEELLSAIERVRIAYIDVGDPEPSDFIFNIFKSHGGIKTYGENIFLHLVISYKQLIEKSPLFNENFEQFFRTFFIYVSIKNEFYQQVTQPTVMHGLDFFRGYFDRATDGITKNRDYFKTMLRTLFQNRYLKKVELRISIKNKLQTNKQTLYEILSSYREVLQEDYKVKDDPQVDFPMLGIVYHLIKQPDNSNKDLWQYDGERDHTLKKALHFGDLQEQYIKQVQHLQELRRVIPMATNFIVGLDAASLENNTPVQVFAPVFEEARDSKYDALRIVDPEGNILPRQSLFFTFHAGEDFRHLISGLRRIDEVIRYCKLHAGDRIGHGIALGVDIPEWVRHNPLVIMPRGEYLDNLLWIWGVYSYTAKLQTETLVYLERTIDRIALKLFEQVVSAGDLRSSILYDVYERRFKRRTAEVTKLQQEREKKRNPEDYERTMKLQDKLYAAYHQEETLLKMEEPIYVMTDEIEQMMMSDMQNYLIHKVSVSGIVIEVNPSSNEAIGEIDSVFGNQLFKLQSAGNSALENVLVNVNSDDPMVFNTNVSNELVYMYYGMLQQGMGREAALDWIEKLRKAGMDTSFIRGARSRKQYLDILDMTINALETYASPL
ncbi:hypothetical protein [Paenibacillus sp. FSL R7-0331]|uniref:hypothetical protein n=1 Tax=Paenibacillus sp. FSL R7-0331 TaxID=1536773 RepID=UPI0004F866DF|nr:hypothetical protein [Paenibacillus sp. FSL R7-0331]AIQ52939.1 hypothetical protein R70331_16355 [Paenibacillus sp. FSL R7-0331]